MKLKFDRRLKLAGIGITPWTRVGLERWLPNYKIASYFDFDVEDQSAPEVISIFGQGQRIKPLNTSHLLQNRLFQKVLSDKLADYSLLTYKPLSLTLPDFLSSKNIRLTGGAAGKSLENKALLRSKLSHSLPFPRHTIIDSPDEAGLINMLAPGRKVVIQDQGMSGGRGTYIVETPEEIKKVMTALKTAGKGQTIVVSEFVEKARERSIQAVITKHGTFVGPLQKQIIANPNLWSGQRTTKDKFCGAEVDANDPLNGLYTEMKKSVRIVAKALLDLGYKGVFGVDFIVSGDGKVYILEVNQRLTGVTPLLTSLYRPAQDIPFFLLHALETANIDYELTEQEIDPTGPTGSLLVLHNKAGESMPSDGVPASGLYDLPSQKIMRSTCDYAQLSPSTYLVQRYYPPGIEVAAGAKLAQVFLKTKVLDTNEKLSASARLITETIYNGADNA